MQTAVPTLSSRGWLKTNDEEKIAQLLAHYFATDGAQDHIYASGVTPVPVIMKESGDNIGQMLLSFRNSIFTLFSRYFDVVEIDVVERENVVESNKLSIAIKCDIINNGVRHSLAIAYGLEGSKFKQFIDVNNGVS